MQIITSKFLYPNNHFYQDLWCIKMYQCHQKLCLKRERDYVNIVVHFIKKKKDL